MKRPTPDPKKRKPTLTLAAKELGVTRTHLSLVLHGHRVSSSLSSRYSTWLKKKEAQL